MKIFRLPTKIGARRQTEDDNDETVQIIWSTLILLNDRASTNLRLIPGNSSRREANRMKINLGHNF